MKIETSDVRQIGQIGQIGQIAKIYTSTLSQLKTVLK